MEEPLDFTQVSTSLNSVITDCNNAISAETNIANVQVYVTQAVADLNLAQEALSGLTEIASTPPTQLIDQAADSQI